MARHMHWAILAYVLCIAKYMQLLIYSKLEETGFGIASRPTEEILSCREPVQNLCLQDVAKYGPNCRLSFSSNQAN